MSGWRWPSLGVSKAVNVGRERLADAQRELDMHEGFDVGLEMSGSPAALRDMITQMTHGGRIAMLGLPAAEISVDLHGGAQHAHHQGIYGREMFETWYEMSVLLESGLDISGVITDRFPTPNTDRPSPPPARERREGDHDLGE